MAASESRVAEADRSFERLYRTHRRDVYNFVLHDVRNPDEAEDVTQVAFLNAYRALRSGRPPEKPRAWLLTIAQNVSRRRFRRRSAQIHEVPLDPDLVVAANDYDGPTAQEIHAAFRVLPDKQRSALAMRELQGRSYAEIADALGVSVHNSSPKRASSAASCSHRSRCRASWPRRSARCSVPRAASA